LKLHGYYRSSTTYRLRIALNLKGIDYTLAPVNLLLAEHRAVDFLVRNPSGAVPVLEAEGRERTQSMAILEWLDDRFPNLPLLPADPEARFTVREFAYAIATDLHAPLNLRTIRYLKSDLALPPAEVTKWYLHWLAETLQPLEQRAAGLPTGDFLGEQPGLFECVLIPQLYNARRYGFDMQLLPHLARIEAACLQLPAFIRAHPDNQPDTPKED
jgi:maleylacetoacetate isomerase